MVTRTTGLVETPPPHRAAGRRRGRGPFSRWPRTADAVLAAVLFLVTVHLVDGPGDSVIVRPIGDVPLPVLLVFGVASAALWWRRREPLVVLAVVLVAWTLALVPGFGDLGGVAIVSLYSVGRYTESYRWGGAGLVATVVIMAAAVGGLGDPTSLADSTPWGDMILGAVVMSGAWYIGRRLRHRGERAAALLRERAAETGRIVAEERTRIARELHDIVAHRVSLMTVQAGAAHEVASADPEGARQAMGAVEEAGRQALDELRHLLGVLRPAVDADGLGPQPGLADLPALVAQTREAGVAVTLVADGLPDALPVPVELSAYRIVQECLTNVLKHAGPGARTEVRLDMAGGVLRVEVVDDGPGTGTLLGSGHGIVGMRERALLLGGSLEAAPRPGGGFRVVAQLPIAGEAS